MNKKTKIFIILLVFILLCLVLYFSLKNSRKNQISTELSQRSKEFIATQENNGNFQFSNIEKETQILQESTIRTDCFSLETDEIILENIKTEPLNSSHNCYFRGSSQIPRVTVVITTENNFEKKLSEISAVQFREIEKETYTKIENLQTEKYEQALLYFSNTDTTFFAISQDQLVTISLSDTSLNQNESLNFLKQLYTSLEIRK